MLVRLFCPNCNLVDDDNAMDYFWVECTKEEASEHVFPMLSKHSQSESINWAKSEALEPNAEHDYCYLVSSDLAHIIAKPAFFPFAGQWNAFNPFRNLPEIYDINALDKLQQINVAD